MKEAAKKISIEKRDLIIGLVLVAILLLSSQGSEAFMLYVNKVIISCLLALSLNIQLGNGGLRPLGHAIMFGIGSYGYAIFTVRLGFSVFQSILFTIIAVIIIGFMLGFLLLRKADDLAFSFLSMGLCLLTYITVTKWKFVGMDVGITNVPRFPFATSNTTNYIATVIIISILIFVIYMFLRSPFVQILKACRENKEKAKNIGVDVKKVQLICYVISGLFAALAGIFSAMRNMGTYPNDISIELSMETLIMCLLGGMNSFWGPMLGALIVSFFQLQLSNYTVYYNFWLGLLTVFVVMFLRGGIIGGDLYFQIKRIVGKYKRSGELEVK